MLGATSAHVEVGPVAHIDPMIGPSQGVICIIALIECKRDMLPNALVASRETNAWSGYIGDSAFASVKSLTAPDGTPMPYWLLPIALDIMLEVCSPMQPVASLNGKSNSAIGLVVPTGLGIGINIGWVQT